MTGYEVLEHKFVRYVPSDPSPGVLYISITYATAVHKCCCGCGNKVVTPLSPTDWKLIFDGRTVSLDPSIGNWSFPCKSHYWIKSNRVRWVRTWSTEEIHETREEDRLAKELYFGTISGSKRSGTKFTDESEHSRDMQIELKKGKADEQKLQRRSG